VFGAALILGFAECGRVIWMQALFFSLRPEIHDIADLLVDFANG
jgi:hypothetical protein